MPLNLNGAETHVALGKVAKADPTTALTWDVTKDAGEIDLSIEKQTDTATFSLTGWVKRKWRGSDKTDLGVKGGVKF